MNGLCNHEDGSVSTWDLIILGEEDVCTLLSARLRFIVKYCVTVCSQDHVTGTKHNAIVRVGVTIIEEVINSLRRRYSGSRLLGTNGTESDDYFFVDITGIVKESSNDSLHATDNFVVKVRAGVLIWGLLLIGPVGDFTVFMRHELGLLGFAMNELDDECINVSFRQKAAATIRMFGGVCPFEVNACKLGQFFFIFICVSKWLGVIPMTLNAW